MGRWHAWSPARSGTAGIAGATPSVKASEVRWSTATSAIATTPATTNPSATARALRIETLQHQPEREQVEYEEAAQRGGGARRSHRRAQPSQRLADGQAGEADEREQVAAD